MKGLTSKDMYYLTTLCKALERLEENGYEEEKLKSQLYRMGVYFYRQYHRAGVPQSFASPGVKAPKKTMVPA